MHEEELVGVGVAQEVGHRAREALHRHAHVGVLEQDLAIERVVHRGRGAELAQVVGAWLERALDARPRDRRLAAIEVGVATREALARVLLLDRALGQPHVRLAGDTTSDDGMIHEAELGGVASPNK